MKKGRFIAWGLVLVMIIVIVVGWHRAMSFDREGSVSLNRTSHIREHLKDVRPPRGIAVSQWKREVENLLAESEAKRCRILSRKQTVDSEIVLLAVESPTDHEIKTIRESIDQLSRRIPPEMESRKDQELEALIADYDPFGNEGRRVIQIDLPDEPNGRLSGFTCRTDDFSEMVVRFLEGEMTNLQSLRGYSAEYAGMPLERFSKLIAMNAD